MSTEKSIRWQWDFGRRVSVLTSPDLKFRIATWPVVNDNGEYECFGLLQVLNERTHQYDIYTLVDKSEDIVNRQEETLTPDNWLGAVYQELVTTTHDGRTYYTLLGWNGVDNLTQRKIIEPISFKGSNAIPQFGQALFRRERNLRRIVLEYKHDAMVNLRYEEQFVRTVETVRAKPKKVKGKGKSRKRRQPPAPPVQKIHDEKLRMIIYDEVQPQIVGMEGLYQYYVPSGVEMALVFVDGKWERREGAQGRVDDKKLNKDFSPIEKAAPAYLQR